MELHDDDKPIGRILNRREILKLLGGAGALVITGGGLARIVMAQDTLTATATAAALPGCVVRPALTEGPYFVDEMLNRSDVRSDADGSNIQAGLPLYLKFHVLQISEDACTPLVGAQVDIWHANAAGQYSDVTDQGFNTSGHQWLRGYQLTDTLGMASFTTIYPGWYSGRAVHIHFKIRTDPAADSGYEFTSQLFFPEEITDLVHAQAPYASKGKRDTLNANDGIYQGSGGETVLDLVEEDDGYSATFDIGLDLSAEPVEVGSPGGGAPPGGQRPGGPPPGGRP